MTTSNLLITGIVSLGLHACSTKSPQNLNAPGNAQNDNKNSENAHSVAMIDANSPKSQTPRFQASLTRKTKTKFILAIKTNANIASVAIPLSGKYECRITGKRATITGIGDSLMTPLSRKKLEREIDIIGSDKLSREGIDIYLDLPVAFPSETGGIDLDDVTIPVLLSRRLNTDPSPPPSDID
jgi:hypothetical protein